MMVAKYILVSALVLTITTQCMFVRKTRERRAKVTANLNYVAILKKGSQYPGRGSLYTCSDHGFSHAKGLGMYYESINIKNGFFQLGIHYENLVMLRHYGFWSSKCLTGADYFYADVSNNYLDWDIFIGRYYKFRENLSWFWKLGWRSRIKTFGQSLTYHSSVNGNDRTFKTKYQWDYIGDIKMVPFEIGIEYVKEEKPLGWSVSFGTNILYMIVNHQSLVNQSFGPPGVEFAVFYRFKSGHYEQPDSVETGKSDLPQSQ